MGTSSEFLHLIWSQKEKLLSTLRGFSCSKELSIHLVWNDSVMVDFMRQLGEFPDIWWNTSLEGINILMKVFLAEIMKIFLAEITI